MSAAFGPGDRLKCVSGCTMFGVEVTPGAIYSVMDVGRPMPSYITAWECSACGVVNGDGVFLKEARCDTDIGRFGWCPCHFRPTWDDEQTYRESIRAIDAVQHSKVRA